MRERFLGAGVIALIALLVGWPVLALALMANSWIPFPYALGAAIVIGLIAFGLDTLLDRRR